MLRPRLSKEGATIRELLFLSKSYYKGIVDNKLKREKLDVIGGKIVMRNGLTFNKETKGWEQSSREVKLDFIISSIPISYKKKDTVAIHKYPVTFLIKDWNLKLDSPFRWRTGGLKKWKNGSPAKRNISEGKDKKEKDKIRLEKEKNSEKNLKILNQNIKNGLQGNFIFHLMWVLKKNNLLFGPLTCLNRKPSMTNPLYLAYFDKTALYVVLKILPRIFINPKVGQAFGK